MMTSFLPVPAHRREILQTDNLNSYQLKPKTAVIQRGKLPYAARS
jgi:hypothetical protein